MNLERGTLNIKLHSNRFVTGGAIRSTLGGGLDLQTDEYRRRDRDLDEALFAAGYGVKSKLCDILIADQTGGRRPINRPTRNRTKNTTNKIQAI